MKKLGITAAALIVIAIIFFLTGSNEILKEAKTQLEQELTTMQQSGFGVENRVSKEKEDHFILTINDPKKVAAYLTAQGSPASVEDIAPLKGMKVGTDIYYVKDVYSALSADFYPVKLPKNAAKNMNDNNKKALIEQIQKMFDGKKILVHIDVAKDLQHFKGYVKDINETFEGEETLHVTTKGWTFTGKTEKEHIAFIKQKVEKIAISNDEGMQMVLTQMDSEHKFTGKTLYDMDAHYHIASVSLQQKGVFSGEIQEISMKTSDKVTNGLLQSNMQSTVKTFRAMVNGEKIEAKTLHWDMKVDNIDIAAIEALQEIDLEDDAAFQKVFQQLLEKGIALTINDFSIQEIFNNQKPMGGIALKATFGIDKQANISQLVDNPLLLIGAIDTNMTLKISDAIFTQIAKDPRAMMMLMMIPPKEEKGQKIYTIIIQNGQTTVNGIAL